MSRRSSQAHRDLVARLFGVEPELLDDPMSERARADRERFKEEITLLHAVHEYQFLEAVGLAKHTIRERVVGRHVFRSSEGRFLTVNIGWRRRLFAVIRRAKELRNFVRP